MAEERRNEGVKPLSAFFGVALISFVLKKVYIFGALCRMEIYQR